MQGTEAPGQTTTADGAGTPWRTADGSRNLKASRRILHDLSGPSKKRRFGVRYWDGTFDSPAAGTPPEFLLVLTRSATFLRVLLRAASMGRTQEDEAAGAATMGPHLGVGAKRLRTDWPTLESV